MSEENTAKEFWAKQSAYPEYGTIKERRLHELNYLVPKIRNATSLLDLGCGDGSLIRCLAELTDISIYHAYDYSNALLDNVKEIPFKAINKKQYDCYNPTTLPDTRVTIVGGVIQYLFEDEAVEKLFKMIPSNHVYVRSACAMGEQSEKVESFSEKLQSNYASYYRTVEHTKALLEKTHEVVNVVRIYPDEIESAFGTKQFYFELRKK